MYPANFTDNLLLERVAVVVVNWNGKDYTLECLQSLQEQQRAAIEIVLVDNGSTDGSVFAVHQQFPGAVIIESGANLGYAGGNNLGLVYALDHGFEHILVLNNDTILEPDCTYKLLLDLRFHPDAAAAAPKSYYFEPPNKIYFAGGKINRDGTVHHIGDGCNDGPTYSKAIDVTWLNGCAIMFRSSALREIGLFEPDFFLFFEDTDWSLRARRAGYRLRLVPDARLWHKGSASFGMPTSPLALYYHTRNQFLWIERNFPLPEKLVLFYFALVQVGVRVRALCRAGNLRSETRQRRIRAVCRGFRDYLLRRFGRYEDF